MFALTINKIVVVAAGMVLVATARAGLDGGLVPSSTGAVPGQIRDIRGERLHHGPPQLPNKLVLVEERSREAERAGFEATRGVLGKRCPHLAFASDSLEKPAILRLPGFTSIVGMWDVGGQCCPQFAPKFSDLSGGGLG
jgi:hypothetical protein